MNFFNIGPMELLFILILALLIFGPGKLPEVVKGLGKAIRDFKQASQGLTEGITKELDAATEVSEKSKGSAKAAADKSASQGSAPESNEGDD